MNVLIISRPKEKEKFYDESKYKVFINGKLVARLKQGETKEISLDNIHEIELQAKVLWCGSNKERIDISTSEPVIEIYKNLEWFNKNGPVFLLLIPFYFVIPGIMLPMGLLKISVFTGMVISIGFAFYSLLIRKNDWIILNRK